METFNPIRHKMVVISRIVKNAKHHSCEQPTRIIHISPPAVPTCSNGTEYGDPVILPTSVTTTDDSLSRLQQPGYCDDLLYRMAESCTSFRKGSILTVAP